VSPLDIAIVNTLFETEGMRQMMERLDCSMGGWLSWQPWWGSVYAVLVAAQSPQTFSASAANRAKCAEVRSEVKVIGRNGFRNPEGEWIDSQHGRHARLLLGGNGGGR
jgi:hypothetical protein